MSGNNVQILSGSVVRATGGEINITAAQSLGEPTPPATSDGSRVYVASGAELDVSGASIVLPVSTNVIPVQLRGTELADSPLQQNGPLRSQTVYVDIRTGTPLANISGEIAAIGYNVVERNLNGGTITINSAGDAILAPGSTVDVAGGYIQYTGGYLNTTDLLTTTGQIVPIGVGQSQRALRRNRQHGDPERSEMGCLDHVSGASADLLPGVCRGQERRNPEPLGTTVRARLDGRRERPVGPVSAQPRYDARSRATTTTSPTTKCRSRPR